MIRYIIGLSGLYCLSACVTTDDPRQGGLIGGIAGLSSGAYDRRIAERNNAISNLQNIQQDLQVNNAVLQQQKQLQTGEVNRLKRQISNLDSEINSLRSQLALLKRKSNVSPNIIRQAERRAGKIQNTLDDNKRSLSQSNDADEIASLEANIESLKSQLKLEHEQAALLFK